MLKIMAVNAGSSSLKFKLFQMPGEEVITEGIVERIGAEDAYYTIVVNGDKIKKVLPVKNHSVAVRLLLDDLVEGRSSATFPKSTASATESSRAGVIFPIPC